MSLKAVVVDFPGSNCDHDCEWSTKVDTGWNTTLLWHKERALPPGTEVVILPGGFAYGDYLRCGAIAALSPVMEAVKRFARDGGTVVGICNGFQVLCESGLLPGALLRNKTLSFLCQDVWLKVERSKARTSLRAGEILKVPIAHGEGCYFAEPDLLDKLEAGGQVLLRYCDREGRLTEEANPNGSLRSIAGICNEAGNVIGMMPHPDRASDLAVGSLDGKRIWEAIASALTRGKAA